MTRPAETKEPEALILAPHGRDASLAASLLFESGISSRSFKDLTALHTALTHDVCFVLVTEESLRRADLRPVGAWVNAQPSWSDLPFIVLTQRGGGPEQNPAAARLAQILGNVTFLERPFHPTTFASVTNTSLRGRRRQYEARQRQVELAESAARLETALLAGHLGAWEVDLETRALVASAVCKSVFGRETNARLTLEDVLASVHPDDRRQMHEVVSRSIKDGSDYKITHRTVWPDGSVHWADINARVIKNGTGAAVRLVGVCADVTSQQLAEQELRLLNETLEERVAARTAELDTAHAARLREIEHRERAEMQLRQSQKMEMIGQLTGGIAHDFNNLLMAVLGSLELLAKQIDQPRQARLVDAAIQGAKRGAALTQRLLAFARRQDLTVGAHDAAGIVEGMRDLIDRSIGSQIELQVSAAAGLPQALVDANQVELALLNLVVNARDAMPDGGRLSIAVDAIDIPSSHDGKATTYVRFAINDTGHGMDAATIERAIEPFFSTKGVGKGTGLGLSMVHGLASQLKGEFRLSSELGRGTRAELLVPATWESRTVLTSSEPANSQIAFDHSLRILVVDDDPLIAMNLTDMLEDLGQKAESVNSAGVALALLENDKQFDLLITDYAMPHMTGARLAEILRVQHPTLPVLLVTGYANLEDPAVVNIPRLGKPYQQAELAAAIKEIV